MIIMQTWRSYPHECDSVTMRSNSGKTAIVTGASSGIGQRQRRGARAGRIYCLRDESPDASDGPNGVTMLACDVTDDASVKALVSTVLSQTGRIDVLVNNAGLGLFGGAEESSVAQVQALFDVNLFGVMRMTNAVLPSMRRRGEGRIINIGSILGVDTCALLGSLFGGEARARGLFGIARPRGSCLQYSRLGHRAGLHPQRLRPERA